MLHAIGLDESDLNKAFVGVASTGFEGNPCNMHLNDLAVHVKRGITTPDLMDSYSILLVFQMGFPWEPLVCDTLTLS